MKRYLSTFFALTLALTCAAQGTQIKGSFKKYAGRGVAEQGYLMENNNGQMNPVQELFFVGDDCTFQVGLVEGDKSIGTIRYIGTSGEFFPVYIKQGATVELNNDFGIVDYGKKPCKENKVFADWYKLVGPLHHLLQDRMARMCKADSLNNIIESIQPKINTFVKKIKTGNKEFDEYVKYMLPHSFNNEVLEMMQTGWAAYRKTDYPKYMQYLFENDPFNDSKIWTLPFAYAYLEGYYFAREIIYNNRMGFTVDFAMENVKDPFLRSSYILSGLEGRRFPNPLEFARKYANIARNDEEKARFDKVIRLYSSKEPGADAIDMAYPDVDGNIHHISDYRGKVIVIDVWATWCAPCKKELPHLETLEEEMEGKDVVFMGLSIDQDKQAWEKFVKERNMKGVQLYTAHDGPIIVDYEVQAVPQFIVFSKEGKLVTLDAPRPSTPELKALIEAELQK